MPEKRNNRWNSLEITKILISLMTPVFLFWLGYVTNESIRDTEQARLQIEKARIESQEKQAAVQQFSKYIYERRARAELLASALKRHARAPNPESLKEVIDRKRFYDEAYFNWNANHQANLLLVRQILGSEKYSAFESLVEFRLVGKIFRPIDSCLTKAYDAAIRDIDPIPILKECNSGTLMQQALDCGYAITDELFKLSGAVIDENDAVSIVDERCP
jgi:hypothetical protein